VDTFRSCAVSRRPRHNSSRGFAIVVNVMGMVTAVMIGRGREGYAFWTKASQL